MSLLSLLNPWRSPRAVLILTLALGSALGGCGAADSSAADENGRFYSEPFAIGNGSVRSYVVLEKGMPVEIGVAMDEASFEGLPAPGHNGGGHADMVERVLPVPEQAAKTPFTHILFGWNPAGHEPPGIYDLPHFDFHFYTMTEAERRAIDPADPQFQQKAARYPAAELIPQAYIAPAPEAVPQMGVHWLDPATPELNGQKFTRTMIYGSWDGSLIFAEPMITKAYLESKPTFTGPLAQPQRYAKPGHYPTTQTIRYDAQSREYLVALGGFVEHGK